MKRFAIFMAILFTLPALAQTVTKNVPLTLTDALNPVGTKHYCYHRVTGGTYSTADRQDLGTSLTYTWILTNPALGTHFWTCTAYYLDGTAPLESARSNEVSWVNPPQPPTLTIGTVAAVPLFKGGILRASTSVPATTIVTYGEDALTETAVVDTTAAVDHEVTLNKLKPHRRYLYQWQATDGRTTVLDDVRSFVTN